MAKKLSSVLGIDIGSHSIKICEVKASGRNATVSAVGVIPTPEGAVDYSGVYDSVAVGAALKQILNESGASSSSAVVSIAGQQSVLVRILEVPRMEEEKELKSHMEWEINKNIPFAETNIMSDFKVQSGGDPSSPNMEVVMAMSPQTAIDTIVDCIKKAGKKPYAIDVEPLGVARSLSYSHDDTGQGKGTCFVDIGHSTTSINIFSGANLVLPRPVPGGGEMITRALADALQLGMQDADDYKQNKLVIPDSASANAGFIDPFAVGGATSFDTSFATTSYEPVADPTISTTFDDLAIDPITGLPIAPVSEYQPDAEIPTYANDPFAVAPPAGGAMGGVTQSIPVPDFAPAPVMQTDDGYNAISGILEDLVSELRRSIDYYSGRGGSVSRIVLSGGGSRLKGLAGYIERSLNVKCEIYDPLKNLNVAPKKVGMDYVNAYREQLTVAVGNGLHILFD